MHARGHLETSGLILFISTSQGIKLREAYWVVSAPNMAIELHVTGTISTQWVNSLDTAVLVQDVVITDNVMHARAVSIDRSRT